MVSQAINLNTADACPHVDRNDHRCGHRFRIGRLEQAFDVCFGAYHGCAMYHRLNREMTARSVPVITVTADGHPLALRPTGT